MKYKKVIIIFVSIILFIVILYCLFYVGQYIYLRNKGLSVISKVIIKDIEIKENQINQDY